MQRLVSFLHRLVIFVLLSISIFPAPCTSNRSRSLRQRRKRQMDPSRLRSYIQKDLVPAVSTFIKHDVPTIGTGLAVGCFASYSIFGLSTCTQQMLGISTGTKVLARAMGVPTVCLVSLASYHGTTLAQAWTRNPALIRDPKSSLRMLAMSPSRAGEYYEISPSIRLPKRDVHVCVVGLLMFNSLGGRFWQIAPSSYTKPGSFGLQSLPATKAYVGSGNPKSVALSKIFKGDGCHTCGTKSGIPHGDHMPPISVGEIMEKGGKPPGYRFFAQCATCSNRQGGILKTATGNLQSNWDFTKKIRFLENSGGVADASYNHAARPRFYHLTGGIIGGIAMLDQNFDQRFITVFGKVKKQLGTWFAKW